MEQVTGIARVLHLGTDPTDEMLLAAEFAADGIDARVARVPSSTELDRLLEEGPVDVIVADLPLPFEQAADRLADVQRRHPEIAVIFRGGSAGNRSVADAEGSTARAVRDALHLRPDRAQTVEERRELIARIVRIQDAQIRLARLDLWDFDATLREVTRTTARVLDVRRVSFWEVRGDEPRLECVLLYDAALDNHLGQPGLHLGPRYISALETGMFVAADDAQHDPRTSEFALDYLISHGITSMLDAPVRRDGRIVGVVCHEHVGPRRRWSLLEQCAAAAIAGLVGRALDVRDRREAERRLREAERFEQLGRLSGRLAHDFNNLLTVICANAQFELGRAGLAAESRASLQEILDASDGAAGLIRQLLAYARPLPAGAESRARAPAIDLRERVDSTVSLLSRLVGPDVHVRTRLADGALWVELDPIELQQVLLNLAANARDAMPGGGELEIELARDESRSRARLSVGDSGQGIAPEVLPHIFEPFFTTKSTKAGTGLGLVSVKEIVHRAGGDVAVRNLARGGACFELSFPLVDPPPPSPRREALAVGGRVAGPNRRVAVVEPDPAVRGVLLRMLRDLGWQPIDAWPATPKDAPESLGSVRPDLVVLGGGRGDLAVREWLDLLADRAVGTAVVVLSDSESGPATAAELDAADRGLRVRRLPKPLLATALARAIDDLMPRGRTS